MGLGLMEASFARVGVIRVYLASNARQRWRQPKMQTKSGQPNNSTCLACWRQVMISLGLGLLVFIRVVRVN